MRSFGNIVSNTKALGAYLISGVGEYFDGGSVGAFEPVPDLRKLTPIQLADNPDNLRNQLDGALSLGPEATFQWLEKMTVNEVPGTPRLARKLREAGFSDQKTNLTYSQGAILTYVAAQAITAYEKSGASPIRSGMMDRFGEDYRSTPEQLDQARKHAVKTLDRRELIRYFFPSEPEVAGFDLTKFGGNTRGTDKAQPKDTEVYIQPFDSMRQMCELLSTAIESKIISGRMKGCGDITIEAYIDTDDITQKSGELRNILAKMAELTQMQVHVWVENEHYNNGSRGIVINFPGYNGKESASYVEALREQVAEIENQRKFAPPSPQVNASTVNVTEGADRGTGKDIAHG